MLAWTTRTSGPSTCAGSLCWAEYHTSRDHGCGGDGRLPAPLDRPGGCRVGRSRKRPVRCAMCGTGRRRCTGFDVRSSTVRIFRTDEGRRFLTITLRAHSRPFDAWMSGVALDTRGDGRVDRIAFLNYPLGAVMPQGERCGIKRASLTRSRGKACTGLDGTGRSRRAASRWSGWCRRSGPSRGTSPRIGCSPSPRA